MEGPEDEVIASDWASGFLDAVSLRPKAWEPLITHDRAGIMIMPILLLSGDAHLDTGTDSAVDNEAFLTEVPDIIRLRCRYPRVRKNSGNHRKPLSAGSSSRGGRRRH